MEARITRREFLDGAALLGLGAAIGGGATAGMANQPPYPPAFAGLRGQDAAALQILHALRDGDLHRMVSGAIIDTGETYDLVVVGGGISGLAAAFLYRQQAGAKARILILEACDDFGGHARRSEFVARSGRKVIGYGGSESLQTPSFFSPAVKALLNDIGVDLTRLEAAYDRDWAVRRGLHAAVFFQKEIFGADRLVRKTDLAADWVAQSPLGVRAKRDLIELLDRPRDYLPGMTRQSKLRRLSEITYAQFLTDICRYDRALVSYFQHSTEGRFGVGIDAVAALDAWAIGNPGFDAMDLGYDPDPLMSASGRRAIADPDPYIYHFPDGNAGLARALVRSLIPEALPSSSMDGLVTTAVDYSVLDRAASPVRLRLNAPVVEIAHVGRSDHGRSVVVDYVHAGRLNRIEAGHAVLACWHRVIPYIFRELGPDQVAALNDQRKVPLVVANILVRNWQAFAHLGIRGFTAPSGAWHGAALDFPVRMGQYGFAEAPEDPGLVYLQKLPLGTVRGIPPREQSVAGQRQLMHSSFAEMEQEIRDLLGRALSGGGFDPALDIEAITIHRWAHGYSREYMRPWDPFWPDGALPIEAARRRLGRIAIANSDSGAYPFADSAIDQAARAVRDLLGHSGGLPAIADFPGPPRHLTGLK